MRGIEEILHMQFVKISLYCCRELCHSGMCCCQLLGWALSVLPQVHFDVIGVTSGVAQFVGFHAKTFAFLGNTLFETAFPLKKKPNFSTA